MKAFLVLLLTALPAAAQDGLRADDILMDASTLDSHLRGQVLEYFDGSKSRYEPDGRYGYTYTDDGPVWTGAFQTFDDSRVCVVFDNGSSRCDLIVINGERSVLITAGGLRFPVRHRTVYGE